MKNIHEDKKKSVRKIYREKARESPTSSHYAAGKQQTHTSLGDYDKTMSA
jgi:hypothetical protein